MRKFRQLGALALLISAVAAHSCIRTDYTIGSSSVPATHDISIQTVEIDLPVGLKLADSLQTAVYSSAIVGTLDSEGFGKITIGTALSITPIYDSIRWGVNPVAKEMFVTLNGGTDFCLDESQKSIPQNLSVYRLNFPLDSNTVYCNSVTPEKYGREKINRGTALYMGQDTLVLYFKNEFAEQLFSVSEAALDSTELFLNDFYGIYLACDETEPENGGRLNNFDLSSSYLTFTFTSTNGNGVRRDTTVYFSLGNPYGVLSIESGNRQWEAEDAVDGLLYQAYNGIKPYIDADKLRERLDKWMELEGISNGDILISNASMEFPFEYDGNSDEIALYPQNLYPHQRINSGGLMVYTPISEIYSDIYNRGGINRSLNHYKPDVALYLQRLIRLDKGDIPDAYDIYMMPTITYTSSSSSSSMDYMSYYYYYYSYYPTSSSSTTYYYADYKNYAQGRFNGTRALRRPVLRITYTVLK